MENHKSKIVVYIATSKDGYIADDKGSVDWLPQTTEETGGQDFGYQEFYQSVDALAIGRKTYEQIVGFGAWPYPGKLAYIFTRQLTESKNEAIEFVSDDIPGFGRLLKERNTKKLWVVGGSELIEAFYRQGILDEFIVTIFPVLLGKGIPLKTLSKALQKGEFSKAHSIDFGSGVCQDHYIRFANAQL